MMLLAVPSFAQWTTFVVDDDGDPLTTYPTLTQAMATANTFPNGPHAIEIRPGTYSDANLAVSSNVFMITGDGAGDVFFVAPAGTDDFLQFNTTQTLEISGINVSGYDNAFWSSGAVPTPDVHDITFDAVTTGINFVGGSGGTYDGLLFVNVGTGFAGNYAGITLQNSVFDTCGYAFDGVANPSVFTGLTISNGTNGIALQSGSVGNTVTGCEIFDMSGYGVGLFNADDGFVQNNTIYNCGDYAVKCGGAAERNDISDNCFFGNAALQGYDDHIQDANLNTWDHNYYGDVAGYTHALAGSGGAVDSDPWLVENNASAASPQDVLVPFTVDMDWTMPTCMDYDTVTLGAYSFTLHYQPTKVQYVGMSAGYYETAFGPANPAFYADPVVDEVAGTITFEAINFDEPWTGGDVALAYAQFEGILANVNAKFWITSEYFGVDNFDTVYVGNTNLFVALEDNEDPVLVDFTANDPIGDDHYSDGSTAGPGPFVKMYMQIEATDNLDLDRIEYHYNANAWATWVPGLSGTSYQTAPDSLYAGGVAGLPEGANSLTVRAVDGSGNYSNEVTYNFTVDRTGPVVDMVYAYDYDECAPDTNFTDDELIKVMFTTSDTDVEDYEIREDGIGSWFRDAFASPVDFTVTSGDANKQIRVRLYDKYNNMGAYVTDYVELDTSPASLSGYALTLDKTADTSIAGAVTYGGQTAEVAFYATQDAGYAGADLTDCFFSDWMAAPASPYNFTVEIPPTEGMWYIWFNTKDRAGNMQTPVVDSVMLDQTAPTLNTFTLSDQEGDVCSEKLLVDWAWNYTDNDAVTLQTTTDTTTPASWYTWPGFPGSTYPDFSASAAFTDVGDGVYTRYARVIDNVGNISNVVEASITVDRVAPVLGTRVASDVDGNGINSSWSDDLTVNLTITGGDMDSVRLAETNPLLASATYVAYADPTTYSFTRTDVTDYGSKRIFVEGRDCANNTAASYSNIIYFDLVDPVWNSIDINGTDTLTNNGAVTVNVNITEVNLWMYLMSEDNTFATNVDTFVTTVTSGGFGFTLTGDGLHTVFVRAIDKAGNYVDNSAWIRLDTGPPAGAMTIVSTNPLAASGWTNVRQVTLEGITYDADAEYMLIRNLPAPGDGSASTGWIPVASSHGTIATPWVMNSGWGVDTVEVRFKDYAANVGPWYKATINFNGAAPAAPAGGSIVYYPGSLHIEWPDDPSYQKMNIRYNFTNDYPTYPNDTAPHPMTMGEGIFLAETTDTFFVFNGGQADIYSVSLWPLGMNGVYATAPNTDVISTNYYLGDFIDLADTTAGQDGCLDFVYEFGALAASYNQTSAMPYFNPECDIAPTFTGDEMSYPVPDGVVDFDDAVIFALLYVDHRCTSVKRFRTDKPVASGPVAIAADVPERVDPGTEFTVQVKVDKASGIFAYHTIFSYDQQNLELISVSPGEIYAGIDQSFFYYDKKDGKLDVSSVILGDDVFDGNEMFNITFRATGSGTVDLNDVSLDVRDRTNEQIHADFNVAKLEVLPETYALLQNYPNPFNPTTNIDFALPVASDYTLTIYNITGQVVTSFNGYSDAGTVSIQWDASGYSSGVYFYKLDAGAFSATRKMVLIK
jgi:hypothetical protein